MENSKKVSFAAAVAAGYILGRTKKGKLALGLASLVAGQQLPLNPREIISLSARKLAENPQIAPLISQVRGEVLAAGRTALSATANRRLEAVADALQQRTNALLEPPAEDEDENAEEYGGEEDEEEPDEAAEQEEEEEPRRPAKRSTGAAKKAPSKKAPAKKAAKKAAAKKPPPRKAADKKTSNRNGRRR